MTDLKNVKKFTDDMEDLYGENTVNMIISYLKGDDTSSFLALNASHYGIQNDDLFTYVVNNS